MREYIPGGPTIDDVIALREARASCRGNSGSSGAIDVDAYFKAQAEKEQAKTNRLVARLQTGKTAPDYVARMAVGTGNALATVAGAPFKGLGFLARGAYELAGLVANTVVAVAPAVAPHIANMITAYRQPKPVTTNAGVDYVDPSTLARRHFDRASKGTLDDVSGAYQDIFVTMQDKLNSLATAPNPPVKVETIDDRELVRYACILKLRDVKGYSKDPAGFALAETDWYTKPSGPNKHNVKFNANYQPGLKLAQMYSLSK